MVILMAHINAIFLMHRIFSSQILRHINTEITCIKADEDARVKKTCEDHQDTELIE